MSHSSSALGKVASGFTFSNTGNIRHEYRSGTDSSYNPAGDKLSTALHPLFVYMKVFALFPSYRRADYPKYIHVGLLIYTLVILSYDWFNVGRFFFAYEGNVFGPILFLKTLNHLTCFQIALGTTWLCVRSHKIPVLMGLLRQVQFELDPSGVLLRKTERSVKAILFVVIIVQMAPLFILLPNRSHNFMMELYSLPFKLNLTSTAYGTGIKVGTAVAMIFLVGQWAGSMAFLVISCLQLSDYFRKLKYNMKHDIDASLPNEMFSNFDLELYRKRHIQLCKIIVFLDDIVSVYVLVVYVTNVLMVCFSIYVLINTPFLINSGSINLLLFSIMSFIYLMIITAAGTILSYQAKGPQQFLYNMNLNDCPVSTDISVKLSLFLGKLAEGHHGITGWRVFSVNKQTTKKVIILIIGYVVILLKFGNKEAEFTKKEVVDKSIFHAINIMSNFTQ